MFRRLLPVLVAVGLATTVVPAHAAAKTTKLYFGNTGSAGETGCNPVYSLVPVPTGSECSGTFAAVNGQGDGLTYSNDTYSSLKRTALKVDTKRKLTGTIYVEHFAIINTEPSSIPSFPGYFDLTVTIKMNGVKVGDVHMSGPALPGGSLKNDFSLALPKSLAKATVTKVTAAVAWNTAVGLSGITYHDPVASYMQIPLR
ncbi:MAG TPA: hypothetical protein VFQ85_06075 [Mycobacteriales bacterium]|jgi:hypothetical protein|nr:hypothetical protein [Mycobacteriales bacterium]